MPAELEAHSSERWASDQSSDQRAMALAFGESFRAKDSVRT